jgi:hypothetical protein
LKHPARNPKKSESRQYLELFVDSSVDRRVA